MLHRRIRSDGKLRRLEQRIPRRPELHALRVLLVPGGVVVTRRRSAIPGASSPYSRGASGWTSVPGGIRPGDPITRSRSSMVTGEGGRSGRVTSSSSTASRLNPPASACRAWAFDRARHARALRSPPGRVHLLADDGLDLSEHAHSQRQPRMEARGEKPDQTGPEHQAGGWRCRPPSVFPASSQAASACIALVWTPWRTKPRAGSDRPRPEAAIVVAARAGRQGKGGVVGRWCGSGLDVATPHGRTYTRVNVHGTDRNR